MVISAWIQTCALPISALPARDRAHHLSRLDAGLAGRRHARRVAALYEPVFLEAADRDLHEAVRAFADDRLLGDDVRQIFPYGLPDHLAVAQAIARAAVRPKRVRGRVGPEHRAHRTGPSLRPNCPSHIRTPRQTMSVSPSRGCSQRI